MKLGNVVRTGIVAASLCLPLVWLAGCDGNTQAKAQLGAPSGSAEGLAHVRENVTTAPVKKVTRPVSFAVMGSLMADEQSDVASRRGGIVKEAKVERGQLVKKGDVLVVLDPTDAINKVREGKAEAAELAARLGLSSAVDHKSSPTVFNVDQQPDVKMAKAMLDLAEKNLQRDNRLVEQKVVATSDYDRTKNEYDMARQRYDGARQAAAQLYQSYQTSLARLNTWMQMLQDMEVRAPFDGLIAERYSAPGESVKEGDRIVSLVRITPLRLELSVPEQQVSLVREGQKVDFEVSAFPGHQFQGTIKYVGASLEGNTRTLIAEAVVGNEDGTLRPGLFATAKLLSPREETRLLIPRGAVQYAGETAKIFVIKDGRAREVIVTIGTQEGDDVTVTKGLIGNETVLADTRGIADGTVLQ
jgi:RND family efflux transporter MFP subunit